MGYGVFNSFILFQKPAQVRLPGDSFLVGLVFFFSHKIHKTIIQLFFHTYRGGVSRSERSGAQRNGVEYHRLVRYYSKGVTIAGSNSLGSGLALSVPFDVGVGVIDWFRNAA